MFWEILVHLIILFGVFIITIVMFEDQDKFKDKYILEKKQGAMIKVIVKTKGISEDDVNKVNWIIKEGRYEDILDIATTYKVISVDKKFF